MSTNSTNKQLMVPIFVGLLLVLATLAWGGEVTPAKIEEVAGEQTNSSFSCAYYRGTRIAHTY